MKGNRQKVDEKKRQLEEVQERLFTVEEKWIKNEIAKDTYDRWHSTYNHTILNLQGAIERLSGDQGAAFEILEKNLYMLSDMRYVYTKSDTMQKRDFISRVFDNNLYYQDGIYRTPTMLRLFTHNTLKMKEKGCLIYEKKEGLLYEVPPSGERGIRTPGPVTVNGFQDRRIRPLCHLSAAKVEKHFNYQKPLPFFTHIFIMPLLLRHLNPCPAWFLVPTRPPMQHDGRGPACCF